MLLLATLLLSAALARSTEATKDPRWVVDHWTAADGLPIEHFTGIEQTPDGMLWLASYDGLIRFDGKNFVTFRPSDLPGLPSSRLTSLAQDASGQLWVATEVGALARIKGQEVRSWDPSELPSHPTTVLTRGGQTWILCLKHLLRVVDGEPRVFGDPSQWGDDLDYLWDLQVARDGSVWVNGRQVLLHLDATGKLLAAYRAGRSLSRPPISSVILDPAGEPIVADDAGPMRLHDGHFVPLLMTGDQPDEVICGAIPEPGGALTVLGHTQRWWRDPDGRSRRIGPSSYEGCLDLRGRPDQGAWRLQRDQLLYEGAAIYQTPSLLRAALPEDDRLWFVTAGSGLYQARPAAVRMVSGLDGGVGGVIAGGAGELVAMFQSALVRFDHGTHPVEFLDAQGKAAPLLSWQDTATADRAGHLWFGGSAGLCWLDGAACRFPAAGVQRLRPLVVDGDGSLWLDTATGLARTRPGEGPERGWEPVEAHDAAIAARQAAQLADGSVVVAMEHQSLRHYTHGRVEVWTRADGLGLDMVRDLVVDRQGLLWIATVDGGLCRLDLREPHPALQPKPTCLGRESGLNTDTIHSVSFDSQGRIWMSTNQGILTLPRSEVDAAMAGTGGGLSPLLLDDRDGMARREANGTAWPTVGRASDGRLYFPTQRGVAVVDTAKFPKLAPPEVQITSMALAGADVNWNQKLSFSPNERDVSFTWTAPEFRWPEQVRFRYRLRGYDDSWSALGAARSAGWTNLPPGDYTLEVEAALGGAWSQSPAVVAFTRRPSFVETAWFPLSIGVGAMALAAALAWRRSWVRRARIQELEEEVRRRTAVLAERNADLAARSTVIAAQAARLAELDTLKSTFVSNLSHELRTPLTLVLGPLEELKEAPGGLDPRGRAAIDIAYRNAERLRELVQQLFDVARLDTGGLPLRARRQDLGAFTRGVVERFQAAARERGLRLEVDVPDGVTAWFDPDLIDKVLTNLVSNALKFTPAGGHVGVALRLPADAEGLGLEAALTVTDTGPGIAPEQQARIFERFYQVDSQDQRRYGGAGIGLSLARELVELHGGALTLVSTPGQGSAFRFTLPLGAEHLRPDELDLSPSAAPRSEQVLPEDDGEDAGRSATVLVVEDHADLRDYLANHLSQRFRVRTAPDGAAALASIRAQRPDLVVSDVMMPELDGIALCRALRADPALAHLPVILVSAKGAASDQEAGLAVANAWFSKPFRMRELVEMAMRLAPEVRAAPEALEIEAGAPSPPETLTEEDRRFLHRLVTLVQDHVGDSELSVALLARRMALSRRQLLREVRRLIGQSVVAYIQRVRLETAQVLLRTRRDLSVSEVAEAVGMNRAYFSRLYSGWYGTAPSEDREPRVGPSPQDTRSPVETLSPVETWM